MHAHAHASGTIRSTTPRALGDFSARRKGPGGKFLIGQAGSTPFEFNWPLPVLNSQFSMKWKSY
jgi:hypothetical protein